MPLRAILKIRQAESCLLASAIVAKKARAMSGIFSFFFVFGKWLKLRIWIFAIFRFLIFRFSTFDFSASPLRGRRTHAKFIWVALRLAADLTFAPLRMATVFDVDLLH